MENIIAQIKQFPTVATLLSDDQIKEIGEKKLAEYVKEGEIYQAKFIESTNLVNKRITELQDKAILEGLTDAEKEEYKKLKGGE
jgi:DNA-binding TFAR19-related protein (PDSD5 family)